MADLKEIWHGALSELEQSVSKPTFVMCFKDTYPVKFEDGTMFLSVPNQFVRDWISDKHHKSILKYFRGAVPTIRTIEYMVSGNGEKRGERPQTIPQRTSLTPELPLQEHLIDRETNLNPRYTFDTFVVGPFNELAHTAAQAVVRRPGQGYNPFFVYGNTGHGKTHLIQAIGNELKKLLPGKRVHYVSSERFAMDFINALNAMRVSQYKEKYRRYDVLIMDDIQFFSNKDKSQEELFHLFNSLYAENKQIVFSSDKHPNFLPGLEERLKSRFSAGMIVDIPQPDQESRAAILKAKAAHHSFSLPEDICQSVAAAVDGNIRELEGILNSLIAHTQLKGRDLSIIEVKNIIRSHEKPRKITSVKDVVRIIAQFYNIDEASIYEKTRRKEVVKPRQVAMFLLREDCGVSYPLIGQKLGGRDHTTVIHSYEKIKQDIKNDGVLESEVRQIRTMIQ